MPAKNSQKLYVSNAWYHVYNRGVEKRTIFQDAQDYGVFCSYLKEYLSPKDEVELRNLLQNPTTLTKDKDSIIKAMRMNNFYEEISLGSYCLMPNHFHLLIKQRNESAMDRFMSSIGTRYAMFFNRKYKRVGGLYQGVYKAVQIENDMQLLHVSRYIHRNPLDLQGETLQTLSQQHSSYSEYLGLRKTSWIHAKEILEYFTKNNKHESYEDFVRMGADGSIVAKVIIDGE